MRIKITAKRQATLPKQLCQEMRLGPGHALEVKSAMLDGQRVWVLSPPPESPSLEWVGSLNRYAGRERLDMDAIRNTILEAMAHGELD